MGSARPAKDVARPERVVSINPATGVPLGDVPIATADTVRAAVARARRAQRSWGALAPPERCRRVARLGVELMERAEEVVELLVKEGGKTRQEALMTEVAVVVDLVRYFSKRAPRLLAPQRIPLHLMKHRKSTLLYVPRGVVGIIAPWNFPLAIPLGEVAMALMAGNGVVLKPSEITPLIALKAKEIYDACGLPPDLFQVVTGTGETGAALIDAGIQFCVFTGSVATGRKVAAACGERLIPCTLELGGKAPAIVCADADLERTARAITWGGFANAGQVCASVERVYAHEAIYDELVARIVEHAGNLSRGDAWAESVDVGAMTWDRQLERVDRLVKAAVAGGARVEVGGERDPGPGLFFQPTVLTGVTQDMEVMREEIFGPVIPIMRVPSEARAVELANDSDLGLVAYVFTKDRNKGKRLAAQVEAGTVMVNDVLATYGAPETPWGGIKNSGIGRTHSAIGLRDLCEIRHVNSDRFALQRDPWWYPYTEKSYRAFLRALRFFFAGKRRAFPAPGSEPARIP